MEKKKSIKKTGSLSMGITLILFAIIPLICVSIVLSFLLIRNSSNEIQETTYEGMVSLIKETGLAFDEMTENSKSMMEVLKQAPFAKEFLENPADEALQAEAQQYILDVYGQLEGWEGIYYADWTSTIWAHPSTAIVGKATREGDSLKTLQDSMLAVGDGVYNVGIINSPASGKLIMSMYAPIYDGATPIGYVGAGTFVNDFATKICDVSSLGLSSAYIYFVDKNGTMLYHPDESKIGNPVENAAVKSLVAELAAGKHPEPSCIAYEYKGANKYAAYYIGEGENYIAVLTADEEDAMAGINNVKKATIVICLVAVAIFVVLSIIIARVIAQPLKEISKATEKLSTGDVTAECNAKSHIKEIVNIINAFGVLRSALSMSMQSVKDSADVLNGAIANVDGMTNKNVDSVSQISTAIDEVAKTSQAVAENAQIMTDKAYELGKNVEELNENVINLYDASQTIKNANNEATECMKSVYEGANESVEAMANINNKISETNNAITQIGEAVQAIESIAAQTNLLSLNASIEAARAGEAGRGFAVVADEIRSLADSSAESAKEIKQLMDNIIVLSSGTVEISNRVNEVITKEQKDIENAQDKFNVLSESVEASIAEIDTIKEMTGKLDAIKVDLANTTNELGAISEELGASAEEVAASCQTVAASCADTQNSTSDMRNAKEDMNEAIEFFKLS